MVGTKDKLGKIIEMFLLRKFYTGESENGASCNKIGKEYTVIQYVIFTPNQTLWATMGIRNAAEF